MRSQTGIRPVAIMAVAACMALASGRVALADARPGTYAVEIGWESGIELGPHPRGLEIRRVLGPPDGEVRQMGFVHGEIILAVNSRSMVGATLMDFREAIRQAERIWGRAVVRVEQARTRRRVWITADYDDDRIWSVAYLNRRLDEKISEFNSGFPGRERRASDTE